MPRPLPADRELDSDPRAEPAARLLEAVLARGSDPHRLAHAARLIAEEGRRHLPLCETVVLVAMPGQEEELQIVGAAGPWAQTLVGQSMALSRHRAARWLHGQSPVDLGKLARQSRLPAVLADGGIQSGWLIPLALQSLKVAGNEVRAAMGFWKRGRGHFTLEEQDAARRTAGLATLILVQVEAWRTAARSEERLRLRKAIAEDVQSSLDTIQVVENTVAHLLEIAAADRVTLSVIEGDHLRILSSRDRVKDPGWAGIEIPLSRALGNRSIAELMVSRRARRGGPFTVTAAGRSMGFGEELRAARHTALIPLVIRDEVIGIIALTRRSEPPFSDDEIVELEILASVAALALRNARLHQQAQAAAAAQSLFLNLAAHELRTPYTVISGYLSMFASNSLGPPPPSWKRALAAMRTKNEELGNLIEQILQATRAESARFGLTAGPVRLVEVVKAAVERLQARLDLHGGAVSITVDVDPLVQADASAVGSILDNLLNNAVNYRRGPPRIDVAVSNADEAESNVAVVRVRDDGAGIQPEDVERIFDRFQRGKLGDRPMPGGAGLGLYIARRLAEEMRGTLRVEWSEPGRGSEFTLLLPVREEGQPTRSHAAGTGETVLQAKGRERF